MVSLSPFSVAANEDALRTRLSTASGSMAESTSETFSIPGRSVSAKPGRLAAMSCAVTSVASALSKIAPICGARSASVAAMVSMSVAAPVALSKSAVIRPRSAANASVKAAVFCWMAAICTGSITASASPARRTPGSTEATRAGRPSVVSRALRAVAAASSTSAAMEGALSASWVEMVRAASAVLRTSVMMASKFSPWPERPATMSWVWVRMSSPRAGVTASTSNPGGATMDAPGSSAGISGVPSDRPPNSPPVVRNTRAISAWVLAVARSASSSRSVSARRVSTGASMDTPRRWPGVIGSKRCSPSAAGARTGSRPRGAPTRSTCSTAAASSRAGRTTS